MKVKQMRIRMKDGVPLWDSDCLRLKTTEAFLSSPGTFHLQWGWTRAPDFHVPALSYTSATKGPIQTDHRWTATNEFQRFTYQAFRSGSWNFDVYCNILEVLWKVHRFKKSQVETALAGSFPWEPSPRPRALYCVCRTGVQVLLCLQFGDGVGCRNKIKGSSKCVNCAIISWNAVLCFPRASIYKAHGSWDSQQI